MMRPFTRFLSLLTLALGAVSCSSSNDDCDPDKVCDYYVKPEYGAYHVTVSIDDVSTPVYLVVFKGQYDQKDTVLQDLVTEKNVGYTLPVGEYYSTAAYYVKGSKTYISIDGDRVSATNNQNCGEDCWSVTEGYVRVLFKE
jgi:hypothetical protein